MSSIIDALKQERSQLINELSSDPRFMKLQKIEELLATYSSLGHREVAAAKAAKPSPVRKSDSKPAGEPSKRAQIESAVKYFLTGKGSVHRSRILEHLQTLGLIGSDIKNPMGRVAIYLSDMAGIVGDGLGNWRLIEQQPSGKGLFA